MLHKYKKRENKREKEWENIKEWEKKNRKKDKKNILNIERNMGKGKERRKNYIQILIKFLLWIWWIWELEMKKEGKLARLYYKFERRYQGLRGVKWKNSIAKVQELS